MTASIHQIPGQQATTQYDHKIKQQVLKYGWQEQQPLQPEGLKNPLQQPQTSDVHT